MKKDNLIASSSPSLPSLPSLPSVPSVPPEAVFEQVFVTQNWAASQVAVPHAHFTDVATVPVTLAQVL